VSQTIRVFHPPEQRHWRGAKTEALVTLIWYPTNSGPAQPHGIGPPGRPVLIGHPLVPQAPIAAGRHPLILLSHGTGGSADSLDWFGAALAERGYLVVGVNHPGNNALEPLTAAGFRLWWERATDLRNVLDGMLVDPQLGPAIDARRIGAAGFSLGGYTVLELAGARTNVDVFLQFCGSPAADAICHPRETAALEPKTSGGDLTDADPATKASLARSGASFRDPRIRSIFAMAPAIGQAFEAADLAEIKVPVSIVAGDGDKDVPVATNARHYASLIPHASIAILPGGVSHYTFLSQCVPAVMDRLAAICRDAPGVNREVIHQETAERAIGFFAETLNDKDQSPTAPSR
jgi:predicted dienelactone hydrolase